MYRAGCFRGRPGGLDKHGAGMAAPDLADVPGVCGAKAGLPHTRIEDASDGQKPLDRPIFQRALGNLPIKGRQIFGKPIQFVQMCRSIAARSSPGTGWRISHPNMGLTAEGEGAPFPRAAESRVWIARSPFARARLRGRLDQGRVRNGAALQDHACLHQLPVEFERQLIQ